MNGKRKDEREVEGRINGKRNDEPEEEG